MPKSRSGFRQKYRENKNESMKTIRRNIIML